ncbi:hypothetical protein [Sporomusa aerivorans]|uniref:hypothetical protein n=1 Tax=Sporomusa aerivorans TaxID=204936 RepID=UPI00352B617B
MRLLITLIGLLGIPAICSAHSGIVARTFASYLPFVVPLLPAILLACYKFCRRCFGLRDKE